VTSIVNAAIGRETVANQFPGVSAMNLMVVGRDYDYDNKDQILKTHARSDLLMMARFDFTNGTVHILSIPRDLEAEIPGHKVAKINAAYAYHGPDLASQTVLANIGIPTDHYIAFDFDAFVSSIDILNGVDLNVDKQMDYDDNWGHLHIHLKPGFQHLDGNDAIGFVRFRHSDSDLARTRRQQELLSALEGKLMQPSTIMVLPQILGNISSHTDTDLTQNQQVALAMFLKKLPKQQIMMATLPSHAGPYYVTPEPVEAAALVTSWFGVQMPSLFARPAPVAHRRHRRASNPEAETQEL